MRELSEPLPNSEIQITDDLHLAALTDAEYEPVMLFLNHSCEPNVGFAGNTIVVTMRAVAAGEELTTDYALFDDHAGQMCCHCGTTSCRQSLPGRTGDDLTCSSVTRAISPGTCSAASTHRPPPCSRWDGARGR